MGFASGWKSAVQSVAQTVTQLAGQAVSMLSLTLTQTTGNVALLMTTGAKLKLGGGTTDTLVSDGATKITAAGLFNSGDTIRSGNNLSCAGGVLADAGIFEANTNVLAKVIGQAADGATAVGVASDCTITLATAGAKIHSFRNNTTEQSAVDKDGRYINTTPGNSTGAPGNATSNTASGRSAIATGTAAATITNSLVSATSIVFVVLQTADGTLTFVKSVVPAAGSFVVTGNANATGNTNFGWFVFNV